MEIFLAKKKNCYEILGVTSKASNKEIKKAYRKLAMKFHPDSAKRKGIDPKRAETKFKEIGEAYSIISDSEKRKMYDRFGWAAFDAGFQHPSQYGPNQTVYTSKMTIDPYEIFRKFFGPGFDSYSFRSGRNRYQSSSFFIDDFFNDDYEDYHEISIHGRDIDYIKRSQSNYILPITLKEALEGTVKEFQINNSPKIQRLTIPPGIANGTTLKIDGKYHITIEIGTQNSDIKVVKNNIEIKLRLPQNLLNDGGKIRLPLLSLIIKIPVGSKSGQKLRIIGKGINPDGNLLVSLLEK